MPKIYVNYLIKKDGTIKLFNGENDVVFVDMPIAVADFGVEYEKPVFYQGNMVIEEAELLKSIEEEQKKKQEENKKVSCKKFKLVVDEETGKVRNATYAEIKNKKFKEVELGSDTDVDKLVYVDGEFLLMEEKEGEK